MDELKHFLRCHPNVSVSFHHFVTYPDKDDMYNVRILDHSTTIGCQYKFEYDVPLDEALDFVWHMVEQKRDELADMQAW